MLPETDFYKSKACPHRNYRQYQCKECDKRRFKAFEAKDPEGLAKRRRDNMRQWQKDNPERYKEYQREYQRNRYWANKAKEDEAVSG